MTVFNVYEYTLLLRRFIRDKSEI